jgi:simple sugar transport system permease protein
MTNLWNMFLQMFPMVLSYSTPIIIAALGGLFSERSGVVNIALEGIMMVGAFSAAAISVVIESNPAIAPMAPWIGLLVAVLAGTIYSTLHAFVSINLKADQVISGTALNILAGGLTVYLSQVFFGTQSTPSFEGLQRVKIPLLGDIPVLGDMLFKDVTPVFYIGIALVMLTWFIVNKTRTGLRLRACGEHPQAAASMGIDVYLMRYLGVLLSGALAGLAGAAKVLASDVEFKLGSIGGTGFIALACLVFGRWNPYGVLGAGLFFGFAQVLSLYAKDIPVLNLIPIEFFYMLPYVLTVVALVIFAGKSKSVGPKAAGEIYDPGKR